MSISRSYQNVFQVRIYYCNVGETGLCFGCDVWAADCEDKDDEPATKSWFGVEWLEIEAVPAFDNGDDNGDPDGVAAPWRGDKSRGTFSMEFWLDEQWTLDAISAWIAAAEGGPGG